MTDAPDPPKDRHPLSRVTRLPYIVVAIIALVAVAIFGAFTVRERATAEREIVGVGDDAAVVDNAIRNPPPR